MQNFNGTQIDTDVLIIGAGAGGLFAALSAKRTGPPGTRVTLIDAWQVGRCGHTAFSNAWTVVVTPEDDLDLITREIIAGNDMVCDQTLVRNTLAASYDRLKDMEAFEMNFSKDDKGQYIRRPTRGLDATRVMYPEGGGLEFSWRMRLGLESAGVQIIDRLFVTGLMRGASGDGVIGAVAINSRSGDFHVLKARTTIICTNAITFRSGFVRDLTGTGTLLAYKAGAKLRNMEFSYTRPSTPRFYFEGIAFAIQEGARFLNSKGERFMLEYEPKWGDESDVPRIARAMAIERQKGNDPLYLDMSGVPEEKREYFIQSKVKWMEYFYRKLGKETRTDMFGSAPYYALNQMTKGGVATGADCRSGVPGLLVGGLAQAGACNHFAGFHIGMCIGTGWAAGTSAIEDLQKLPTPKLDTAEVHALHAETFRERDDAAKASSDDTLKSLQQLMFAYDVSVWKRGDRLAKAQSRLEEIKNEFDACAAPHTHELVRMKETEAMLLAADLILKASVMRTESRMSHFREDFDARDDKNWLQWIDIRDDQGTPQFTKTPIPTPILAAGEPANKSVQRVVRGAA